ncbi:signal peptidase II [Caulobacter henricii]|uniref:Lipoprotein signal peptidase n=1 Tax=Caulobacter henricii TaxID=69395 RepID=A0A0P0NXA2_9CAUL|nr:signal peptidase II [Caulobacter henricii]ALL12355.1 signal peptidase II [Caulobacter henricii]
MTALNITRQGWIAYAIAVATVALDQLTKLWILHGLNLEARGTVLLPGPVDLTMVWNRGMSFGLLSGHAEWGRWLLTGFSTVVVVGLTLWARKAVRPLMAVGLGLIIGGAIGNNLIDRVIYGAVADFIDVRDLYFPWIFNIADAAISVGVAFLLLDSFLTGEDKLAHPTE